MFFKKLSWLCGEIECNVEAPPGGCGWGNALSWSSWGGTLRHTTFGGLCCDSTATN